MAQEHGAEQVQVSTYLEDLFGLRGQVAVVTGGTGVLGAVMVANLELLQHGYQRLVWMQQANAAAFAVSFAAMFVAAALTSLFPASLLGVAAGAAFGFAAGFALSAASLLTAALIAFLVGRYFFRAAGRRAVARFVDLDRIEARLARHGWRYALLLRSAPMSSRPPLETTPEKAAVRSTEPVSAAASSRSPIVGSIDLSSAAAPATWGAAIEVPDICP